MFNVEAPSKFDSEAAVPERSHLPLLSNIALVCNDISEDDTEIVGAVDMNRALKRGHTDDHHEPLLDVVVVAVVVGIR